MSGRLLILALAGLFVACAREPGAPTRHANVLLATVDTLRADRLTPRVAPTLTHLASRGVSFRNARSVVPLTLPAHVSIMTGATPAAHGVKENGVYRFGGAPEDIGPWNCGRGAWRTQMNLRVSYSFHLYGSARLEAIGEIFNVFNAKNPSRS